MIYRLHYAKLFNEFIELEQNAFKDIQSACIASEFQKISREPIEVCTSDEVGGMIFPDFYYDDAVPLFSEALYKAMKKEGIDNLFVKDVVISDLLQDKLEKYIFGLPPRINVLDFHGKIDESKIGRYKIFKILDSPDNGIYINEQLYSLFKKLKPLGMEMIKADVL